MKEPRGCKYARWAPEPVDRRRANPPGRIVNGRMNLGKGGYMKVPLMERPLRDNFKP